MTDRDADGLTGLQRRELARQKLPEYMDTETARERQKASRTAIKMERRAKTEENANHAADVWKKALDTVGIAADEMAVQATTDGIVRGGDMLVATYLAVLASGDPQFAPQHGKEAAEMMKAVASITREYRTRQQLDRLQSDLTSKGTLEGNMAAQITELATRLQARMGQS